MINYENKKKTINIILFICFSIILFLAGQYYEQYRTNKRMSEQLRQFNELQLQCSKLESELERRVSECESIQQQLESVKSDIDDIAIISERSGRIIESIGIAVSGLNNTSTNVIEIIQRLKSNQSTIKLLCSELQNENTELRRKLESIQGSINQ